MKQYKVKKGKHDFRPFQFGLYYNKTSLFYKVKFDSSCRYDLGDEDQKDINKLFGLGYFSWFKSISHTDSARFGWNYNRDNDRINLYSYCYVNGNPNFDYYNPICHCKIDQEYEMYLGISLNNYNFIVWEGNNILNEGSISIPHNHKKKISFLLSPYFGGNKTAPHPMMISLEKK